MTGGLVPGCSDCPNDPRPNGDLILAPRIGQPPEHVLLEIALGLRNFEDSLAGLAPRSSSASFGAKPVSRAATRTMSFNALCHHPAPLSSRRAGHARSSSARSPCCPFAIVLLDPEKRNDQNEAVGKQMPPTRQLIIWLRHGRINGLAARTGQMALPSSGRAADNRRASLAIVVALRSGPAGCETISTCSPHVLRGAPVATPQSDGLQASALPSGRPSERRSLAAANQSPQTTRRQRTGSTFVQTRWLLAARARQVPV